MGFVAPLAMGIAGAGAGAAMAGTGMALAGAVAGGLAGASMGGSMSAAHAERKAYKRQQGAISEQMALNREVAAFNKEVINKLYPETMEMIKLQTRNVVGRQMLAFAHSGAAPGSASPYFVIGEINRMGKKELQRAAFNYQVDLKNEEFRARGILNSLDSEMINARYNANRAGLGMFTSAIDGLSTFGGMFRNGNPFASSRVNLDAARRATENLNTAPLRNGRWVG